MREFGGELFPEAVAEVGRGALQRVRQRRVKEQLRNEEGEILRC